MTDGTLHGDVSMVDDIHQKSSDLEKQRDVFYRFVPAPFIRILGERNITDIRLGDQNRMDTTVISDVVNVASRLESLTKTMKCRIIASGTSILSAENNAHLHHRFLGNVIVKGKNKAIPVYEILGGDSPSQMEKKISCKPDFEGGVQLYMKKNYQDALILFQKVKSINPDDETADFFIRSSEFRIKNPPPPSSDD